MRKYSIFLLLIQVSSALSSKLEPSLFHSRIVAGLVAPKHEYPFAAYYVGKGRLCGGTIVSKKHVVTADHCLRKSGPESFGPTSRDYVIVGKHNITSRDAFGWDAEEIFGENLIGVKRFIQREDNKDIAILELARELEFTDRISAACIAGTKSVDYSDMIAMVAGWGGIEEYEPGDKVFQKSSDVLKETYLNVLAKDSKLCKKAYGNRDFEMCTYASGSDSCQGDSGGPVFMNQNGEYVLIGVVSRGNGCAARGHAGVNMRVSFFAEWIKENVEEVCIRESSSNWY